MGPSMIGIDRDIFTTHAVHIRQCQSASCDQGHTPHYATFLTSCSCCLSHFTFAVSGKSIAFEGFHVIKVIHRILLETNSLIRIDVLQSGISPAVSQSHHHTQQSRPPPLDSQRSSDLNMLAI